MNREWSELNKAMQAKIKKRESFSEGIADLFELRRRLAECLMSFKDEADREMFNGIPFINADGFHSKTIAYSIWHIFRIEDIVAHTLICEDEQVFFAGNFGKRINSPIITTGNELAGREIADFSARLDIGELYSYMNEVKESTEKIIGELSFEDMKRKISGEKKETLRSLGVVSDDEKAVWLIDYWCGKDIGGLIRMPFSRHWIMHTEASIRIRDRLRR